MSNASGRRWNIFARELEDVLAVRGLRLTQINDRTPIYPEKVRRLVRSLRTPKSFNVLNPEEINLIVQAFGLTEHELRRLRAAILTTAIEAMLMDRISQDEALTVAEQVFPLILDAMSTGNLSGVRGGRDIMMSEDDVTEVDIALESTLATIDRATLALHLSDNATSYSESIRFVRQALEDFTAALTDLDQADETIRGTESWRVWHEEAQRGVKSARELLDE